MTFYFNNVSFSLTLRGNAKKEKCNTCITGVTYVHLMELTQGMRQ